MQIKKFFTIICAIVVLALNLLLLKVAALPTATTSAPSTHIISLVHQRKSKSPTNKVFDFDFESVVGNNLPPNNADERNVEEQMQPWPDDILIMEENMNKVEEAMFENVYFGNQQENIMKNNTGVHSRMKQSIPVLEPVRHLINHVRDSGGRLNHTLISQKPQMEQAESAAIETEKDRKMASDSTEFQLLDRLGAFASMIWGFFMNIQRLFAASSSSASAASSSSSSGGSS